MDCLQLANRLSNIYLSNINWGGGGAAHHSIDFHLSIARQCEV